MVQRAALGGASVSQVVAAQAGGAGPGGGGSGTSAAGAGSVRPPVVAPASAAASVAAAAAAAAAAQYDPTKFERLRAGPGPGGIGTPIGDLLERVLRDYLRVMAAATTGGSVTDSAEGSDRDASHWAIVAAACIDYCTTIRRSDLLFGPVYDVFVAANATPVFLLALEPFIMAGRLGTLSPVVMKGFVEAHTAVGAMGRVERCLLRLDLSSLDLNQAVRLCLSHRLFSAFVHVANRGLLDFALPVDVLLTAVATCEVTGSSQLEVHEDRALLPDEDQKPQISHVGMTFGYSRARGGSSAAVDTAEVPVKPMGRALRQQLARKLLLYITYCLTGRRFPRGSLLNPPTPAVPSGGVTTALQFFAGALAAATGSTAMVPPLLPAWLQVRERSCSVALLSFPSPSLVLCAAIYRHLC
jgi:hypothetical protein